MGTSTWACSLPLVEGHGKRQRQSRKLRQLEVQKPQMLKSRPSQPLLVLPRSEVRAKDAGPLKSLLRPPRPVPPQTVWTYFRRKLAAFGCRLRRRSGPGSRGVGFQPAVRVLSYPRKLCGGDGVPTDGSPIALGLGDVATESEVALNSGPRGVPSDQISWMPAEMREQVLADAMGPQSFASARAELQPEMMQLLSLRRDTTEDGKDVAMMPQSMEEAIARARQLTEEVAAQKAAEKRSAAMRRLASPPSPRKAPGAPGVPGPRLWPLRPKVRTNRKTAKKGLRRKIGKSHRPATNRP